MILSTLDLESPYQEQLQQAAAERKVLQGAMKDFADEQLAHAEILFTYGYDIPEETLRKMKSLRWIHVGQSGMDKIPMEVVEEMGIVLTNSKGINAVAISEYVLSMMLNVTRKNYVFYEAQKEKRWDVETHLDELYGKTVGILGLGMVGGEIALRAAAFGMRVLGLDIATRPVEKVDTVYLPGQRLEMLRQCDFVVICMPLTQDTLHLIGREELACLSSNAWVINVGRGPIIHEEALLEALRDRTIAGAVLDVFQSEPLEENSPLWNMPNVIVTPHIAGDHLASYMPRMMEILCGNLARYPHKESLRNRIDPKRGF